MQAAHLLVSLASHMVFTISRSFLKAVTCTEEDLLHFLSDSPCSEERLNCCLVWEYIVYRDLLLFVVVIVSMLYLEQLLYYLKSQDCLQNQLQMAAKQFCTILYML